MPKVRSPRGTQIVLRGQVADHEVIVPGLGLRAFLFAIVLVYLLIVVNFQSWLDPFIIITALPGRARRDRVDAVPHAARRSQRAGADRRDHVHRRGHRQQHPAGRLSRANDSTQGLTARATPRSKPDSSRLRPVLMTALAMIIGMVPMALGLGEGGEQNAPLGRAVIGGLLFATFATLFFVPVVFSMIHGRRERKRARQEEPATFAGDGVTGGRGGAGPFWPSAPQRKSLVVKRPERRSVL